MHSVLKTFVHSAMTSSNRVRWVFDCGNWFPSKNDWSKISRSIQPEEKERIGRFVFKRDAKSSIIGQLMIMKYLSQVTHIPWSKIKIKRDQNNKPVIDGFDLNFNVSHDENLVVFAGEQNNTVGIDIMRNRYKGGKSVNEFFRIMHRNFNSKEWQVINKGCTEEQKINAFYRFWCLKESYVKATGTGLTVNLKNICFVPKSDLIKNYFVTNTQLFVDGQLLSDWVFHEYLYDNNYTVTVCLNKPVDPINFKFLTFEELTNSAEMITDVDELYCNSFMAKSDCP
ncbi:L-aminoadipate-semialdehyde dehydrogenase-phosphopantetheinyl transferase [Adelges cooleyi]|uniref:L-aminoadipate-semialdehyde dehydrogenase-phosphopantetheinyl transferase n=1 Tax=Adelges cooleyi TaxID=133065 RepID=UPI0021807EE0|nr:L-aminoadipate-semialdehyde dehydrogenase-phosphopantetheinyl transferase [Adelges cooleyi]